MNQKSEYEQSILALGASTGSQVAWAEMVKQYDGLVRSLVLKYGSGEEHLFEDLVQDSWAMITRNISGFDMCKGTLRAWLRTQTLATIREGWASRTPAREAEVDFARALDYASDADPPDQVAARNETAASLLRVIDSMPIRQRQAAHLVFIDGKEPIEAARLMGVSKQRIHQMLYTGSSRETPAVERIKQEMSLRDD